MSESKVVELERLRHGGVCEVPSEVATCPECGETLAVRCEEWDAETGEPVWEFIELECDEWEFEIEEEEYDELYDTHRGGQFIWQPVIDRVAEWAKQAWASLPECPPTTSEET